MKQIPKDSTYTLGQSITGQDLTGASVTWILTRLTAPLSGDLDALSASDKLIEKATSDGSISITAPASGTFDVSIAPSDTESLTPDIYRAVRRAVLSDGSTAPDESVKIEITV